MGRERPGRLHRAVPGAPVGVRAPDGGQPGAVQGGDVDAGSVRLDRPAGPHLHGRGVRLRAADRAAAVQEADPHAVQAGASVWRRRRAVHPEPSRSGLQGHLQRRHVDDRSPADRAGQGSPVGRHVVGGGSCRPEGAVRDDLGAGQAPVPHAANRRISAEALRRPLGDELPGRPAVEGPGGTVARPSRGRRCSRCPHRRRSPRRCPR